MTTTSEKVIRSHPDLALTLREAGGGSPVLVLHGGAGPASVVPILEHLAGRHHVLAPTHPGWDGTVRPDRLGSVGDLAGVYLDLLGSLDLADVTVVGSSFGGWIAAEMAIHNRTNRLGRLILLDAVGPRPEPHHLPRVPAPGSAESAGPGPGRGPSPADLALLQAYTGPAMHDPGLRPRLAGISIPALVLWGERDPVVSPAYGRAYADALPDARFVVIPGAGHLPTSEAPEPTFAAVDAFLASATPTAATARSSAST